MVFDFLIIIIMFVKEEWKGNNVVLACKYNAFFSKKVPNFNTGMFL